MAVHSGAVLAVVEARHGQPFDLLGPHFEEAGRERKLVVRAYQPDARRLVVLDDDGAALAEGRQVERPGFFEADLGSYDPARLYRLRFETHQGRTFEIYDAYQFGPILTDFDLHLFKEGTHYRLWEKLGAHLTTARGVSGVHFAVWAPNAKRVSVVGDFNNWDGRRHPMRKHEGIGVWELFIPGLVHGETYKYELRLANGANALKVDPFAFQVEVPPKTAGRVHSLDEYRWRDEPWMERRRTWDFLSEPMSVYEMHFGSWRRAAENRHRSLSYREMATQLATYLKELGFTHVELMPLTEHPFYPSWGYQTVNFFAPSGRYGSPDDLRFFIDAMHAEGIGVILDWVPAHFPADAYALAQFDGTCLFEHADPRQGRHPDWNTLVFNYGRTEIRNFLHASALFWLEQYHFDGLRVDAVASMLYLDYSRKPGQWIPNRYGGRENLEAVEFLKNLNTLVHREHPGVVTIAEESTAWPGVSRPTHLGGLGFNLKWNMGWMHDTLEYFSKNPVHRKYHSNMLTFSMLYAYTENFALALSHDEVVHGKGSLLNKMPGDVWQKRANLRALLAFMYAHPGKKLLFMGVEIGQWKEWNHDSSLDWDLLKFPEHRGIQRLLSELNRLYRTEPSLYQRDFDPEGFRWIDCNDVDRSVYSFLRFAADRSDFIAVVANLTPVPRSNYRIGVPEAGTYAEVLNSDGAAYGGSNMGNKGQVSAEPVPWQGFPCSMQLTLPPLAVIMLKAPKKAAKEPVEATVELAHPRQEPEAPPAVRPAAGSTEAPAKDAGLASKQEAAPGPAPEPEKRPGVAAAQRPEEKKPAARPEEKGAGEPARDPGLASKQEAAPSPAQE
jgi:1,4-alpha-glucan branching enzyme